MAERSQPIRRFHLQGETGAVAAEIAASGAGSALTVLFAAPDHELRNLGEALRAHGAMHVVGATASRVPVYKRDGSRCLASA